MGGGKRRDESAHMSAKPKLHSAQQNTLSGLSECKTFTFRLQIHPELHKDAGYTQADTFRSSNDTAPLCWEMKTGAPPALRPHSSLQTQHLHPTRRYKNRRNQGEFESAFEFVKDKMCDTIMIIRVIAPYWTQAEIDVTQHKFVLSFIQVKQCSPPLSLL